MAIEYPQNPEAFVVRHNLDRVADGADLDVGYLRHLSDDAVHDLLKRVSTLHRWMHIEKLQEFDGELGFTRDQGEN